jgi:hypothetical protein
MAYDQAPVSAEYASYQRDRSGALVGSEITRSRTVAAVSRLQQIDQGIVDRIREFEDVLDRLLGGHPRSDGPANQPKAIMPPPGGSALDQLDSVTDLLGERLSWLNKIVDRAQEI